MVFSIEDLDGVDGLPKNPLRNYQIKFEDLEIYHDDELGSGNFAQVCKGAYCGTEVAIKKMKIPKDEDEIIKYLKREVALLNALRHPNVVQYLGWCQPEDSDILLLVEECVKGGNLGDFLTRTDIEISWEVKISLCLDVTRAMLYLHKNKVLYRDLKADNVLIDDPKQPRIAKLCDFGLARSIDQYQARNGPPLTICGTDEWMAPEVILGMEYDERSDVFSFGVLLLECILGTDTIRSKLERSARNFFELETEAVRALTPPTCPKDFLDTALFCCAYEPTSRPNFNEILILLLSINMLDICDDEGNQNVVKFEEIKIDDILAERLTESLNEIPAGGVSKGDEAAPDKPKMLGSNSKNLTKFLSAPSIFALDGKAEYLRVESMVEEYTMWNVRISKDATVKEVTEKIQRKLDEKYKVVQLYLIHGKKKVLLGLHQVISDIKSTWEADKKTYKFGVHYFENADDPLLNAKNTTLLRVARKDTSVTDMLTRKKENFFGVAPKRDKKG